MSLLDPSRVDFKLGRYGVAPAGSLSDPAIHPRVQEFRRHLSSRMYPLGKSDVDKRIPKSEFHVSRKIDGEFTVLVYQQGEIFTVNPGGAIRVGMPWLEEAAELFAAAGVKEAMIAGELYVAVEGRRPRVHDVVSVARNPESAADLERLRFGVFDIISLDNKTPESFVAAWETIEKTFGAGERIHPVEYRTAESTNEIAQAFEDWVEEEKAEGLVVRSDTAGVFKVKPRHTIDAVVIGFTESVGERQGLLHDLLLAVAREDGAFHILSRVGGGFDEDERRAFLSDLKDMACESEYAEVNSDHVAYQMVEPKWVIEISCLDLISQNTRGAAIHRMTLDWDAAAKTYRVLRRLPLVSVISPQFVRRREDKKAVPADIPARQIGDLVEVPLLDRNAKSMTLPGSEVLRREVYVKHVKEDTMVRKFLLWKTNKEGESEDYPGYVLHLTDFSPNRKVPLQRDIRVSNSQEQIEALWEELKTDNIKRGWAAWSEETEEAAAEPAPAAKKKTAKKKAAAKKKPAAKKAAKKSFKKKVVKKKTEVMAKSEKKKRTPKKKKDAS